MSTKRFQYSKTEAPGIHEAYQAMLDLVTWHLNKASSESINGFPEAKQWHLERAAHFQKTANYMTDGKNT
jgi:hypothetical protein